MQVSLRGRDLTEHFARVLDKYKVLGAAEDATTEDPRLEGKAKFRIASVHVQVVHWLPRGDAADESSLAVGQIRVLGPPVAEGRVALLMDQDEGQLT